MFKIILISVLVACVLCDTPDEKSENKADQPEGTEERFGGGFGGGGRRPYGGYPQGK